MSSNFVVYTMMLSSLAVTFCLILASVARSRTKEEIYKRKIIENKYKHCKTLFAAKEQALTYRLESAERELKSLTSHINNESSNTNRLLNTENINVKYLIEAKDNKIEAQNAKITLLQADCKRLQKELRTSKNNTAKVVDCSTNNRN